MNTGAPVKPATVLVVDDYPPGRYASRAVLEQAGFLVLEAATGADALRLAAAGVDAVLLDINLPDLSGFEVCRRLKAAPATARLPVVHLSALRVENRDLAEGLAGGADAYLTQPVMPGELVDTLRAVLKLRSAQDELRSMALEWQTCFDAISDGILLAGPDGLVRRCNAAMARLLGREPAAVSGQPLPDVLSELGLPATSGTGGGPSGRMAGEFARGDRWLGFRRDATLDEQGRTAGCVLVISDLTETRAAAAQLRRLELAVSQSADGLLVADAEHRIVYVNTALERIFGLEPGCAIGRPANEVVRGDHEAAFFAELERSLASGQVWTGRLTGRRPEGSRYTTRSTVTPVLGDEGRTVAYLGVHGDITREVSLEEQLRQSQKLEAVGMLAGGIAHDFNNLLTVITGHTQLALETLAPEDPLRQDLEVVASGAESAAALTRQLLVFSRRQQVEFCVLDVNAVVEGVLKLLRRSLGEQIELRVNGGPGPLCVEADAGYLEQILVNLAVNARDAMPGGGRLQVSTAEAELTDTPSGSRLPTTPGRYVVLTVADTGLGMDEPTLSRIFEPFFTTKEAGRGTGLGLATVLGVVAQCKGTVAVESRPGSGSTFRVYLPRTERPALEAKTAAASTVATRHETVLLVEDDEAVRRLAARALSRAGYRVTALAGATEALAAWAKAPGSFELLLTDVVLPVMGGCKLAARLRADRPELKILLVSGYSEPPALAEAGLPADTPCFAKPFAPDALLRKVREVLDAGGGGKV